MDNSIITQEEFDKKKSELLAEGLSDSGETERKKIKKHVLKNWLRKPYIKKILIAVLAVATIIGVARIVIHYQEVARASARTSALEEAIEPIMDKYGLNPYSVIMNTVTMLLFIIYVDNFSTVDEIWDKGTYDTYELAWLFFVIIAINVISLVLAIVMKYWNASVFATKHNNNISDDRKESLDDLIAYKELLDSGALTQEEFDKKKKQLLDL